MSQKETKIQEVEEMKFYDVKSRKSFTTEKYKTTTKKVKGTNRKYAIAKSPYSGIDCWRAI